jgi:Cu-Zn family superoxide dismutase
MRTHLLVLLSPVLLLTGCGNHDTPSSDALQLPAAPSASAAPPTSAAEPAAGVAMGTFLPYQPGATAITYDPAVVPAGATAQVETAAGPGTVRVRLKVTGLIPRRAYGAHLHTMACTALPDAAGPHYQHSADPSKPSVDPAYANPANEVWLDFTADAAGTADASAVQPWTFDASRPPRSLILHAQVTRTEPGVAGTAGPRVACLTLPAA